MENQPKSVAASSTLQRKKTKDIVKDSKNEKESLLNEESKNELNLKWRSKQSNKKRRRRLSFKLDQVCK